MTSHSSSSACTPIETHAFGRQGIGVVQPQSGTDFPLIAVPSDDIRNLLADAYLSYDDPADYDARLLQFKLPFHVWYLYGVGCEDSTPDAFAPTPTHEADILVVDDNNCVVFDSTTAATFFSKAWGDRLHVYGWEDSEAAMFIVTHTKWGDTADYNLQPQQYDLHIHPQQATLDERSVERRPKRVKSFQVVLTTLEKTDVDLIEGFNINLNYAGEFARGSRLAQRIVMQAPPQGGIGIFPGCPPASLTVRQINNVSPNDEGDFYAAANDCYFMRQPSAIATLGDTAGVTPAMLQFGNDCVPCCACDDYVASAEYLNRTRDKWNTVGSDAEKVRDDYHTNRSRWCSSKQCFEQHPLRLVLQPQVCPFVDIAGQFSNLEDICVGPLELEFTFNVDCVDGVSDSSASSAGTPGLSSACAEPAGDEIIGYTFAKGLSFASPRRSSKVERYDMSGTWPKFTAFFDAVEPMQDAWVRFRLQFNCCGVDAKGNPFLIKTRLRAFIDGKLVQIPGENYDQTTCSASEFVLAEECDQALLRCPPGDDDYLDQSTCKPQPTPTCPT